MKSPCPICGKPSSKECKPFCSERCKTIDLGRWLNGSYAIPVMEDDDLPDDFDDTTSESTGDGSSGGLHS